MRRFLSSKIQVQLLSFTELGGLLLKFLLLVFDVADVSLPEVLQRFDNVGIRVSQLKKKFSVNINER